MATGSIKPTIGKKPNVMKWIYRRKKMDLGQIVAATGKTPGSILYIIRINNISPGDNITAVIDKKSENEPSWKSIKQYFDTEISFSYEDKPTTFNQFVSEFGLRYESAKRYFAKIIYEDGFLPGDDITYLIDRDELERIKKASPVYYYYQGLLYTTRGLARASGLSHDVIVKRLKNAKAKQNMDVSPIMLSKEPKGPCRLSTPVWTYCGKKMTMQDIAKATNGDARDVAIKIKKASIEPGQDVTLVVGMKGRIASKAGRDVLPKWKLGNETVTVEEIANKTGHLISYVEYKIKMNGIEPDGDVTALFEVKINGSVKGDDKWKIRIPMAIEVTYKGKETSLRDLSKRLNVSPDNLRRFFYKKKIEWGQDVTSLLKSISLDKLRLNSSLCFMYKGLLYKKTGLSAASGLDYGHVFNLIVDRDLANGADVTALLDSKRPSGSIKSEVPTWMYCGQQMTVFQISKLTEITPFTVAKKIHVANIKKGKDVSSTIGINDVVLKKFGREAMPKWRLNGKMHNSIEIANKLGYKNNWVEATIRNNHVDVGGDVTNLFKRNLK